MTLKFLSSSINVFTGKMADRQDKSATIEVNVRALLKELPPHVVLVAAAKSRTPEEVLACVKAGVKIIGENYVQEALAAFSLVGRQVQWHFIGHLQRNKVKKAVEIFDMIETIDSLTIAEEVNKRCAALGKVMPILIEVNSGREPQKFGVMPEEAVSMAKELSHFPHLCLQGLMTMGPEAGDPEEARPYFRLTRELFEEIKSRNFTGVEMKWLSMGMSHSYGVAIEERANMVRLGTKIFGPRL